MLSIMILEQYLISSRFGRLMAPIGVQLALFTFSNTISIDAFMRISEIQFHHEIVCIAHLFGNGTLRLPKHLNGTIGDRFKKSCSLSAGVSI